MKQSKDVLIFLENIPSKNNEILDALAASASNIISNITDFHEYEYGPSSSQLNDEGSGMFSSYGMRVSHVYSFAL